MSRPERGHTPHKLDLFERKSIAGSRGDIPIGLKRSAFAATASSTRRAVGGQSGTSNMNKEPKETMGADVPGDRKGGDMAGNSVASLFHRL